MFRLFVCVFIITLNCTYAGLFLWLLRRRKPWPRAIGVGICLWSLFVVGSLLVMVSTPSALKPILRDYLFYPMAVEMIWNALMIEGVILLLIPAVLAIRRLRPVDSRETLSPAAISRRHFVYLCAAGAAPVTAMAMGVRGVATRYDLRVNDMRVPVVHLPPELEGFTIAHVSDLHSGLFCGPRRLKLIHDGVNDLKADVVMITGDIINQDMDEFPAALAAMQGLRSRYGTYVCEGNHDVIPGRGVVMEACQANNLPVLYNSCIVIPVEGRRLLVGGLPWMKHGFEAQPELVNRLYPQRQDGDVRILLAHHPHLFEIADGTDLVLSGHTHGGQIMLTDEIGFGPLFFRYWTGLYRREATSMVVSNGCGDWFPCRIGAPAEIGLLRLMRA